MPSPYAYIRKSTTGDTDSKADQIANVRRLVPEDQQTALVVLDGDWGISASREQTARRLDFLRLIADVEAGKVSHLYAYHTDRLARSTRWAAQLLDVCADAGIRITTTEREFDPQDATTSLVWNITATMNEAEVRKMKAKAEDRVRSMKERIAKHEAECPGWHVCGTYHLHKLGVLPFGMRPGEDLPAVLQAFREARSFAGAATLLNDRGVPTKRGKRWEETTVRRIVRNAAANGRLEGVTLPAQRTRGRRLYAVHALSGLVRCPHDGTLLTSTWRTTRSGREVGLFCRVGRTSSSHPRPYSVPQAVIFEYVRRVTDTLTGRVASPDQSADVAAMEALRIQRRNAVLALSFSDSADTAELEQRITDLTEQLARLEAATSVVVDWTTGVDWTLAPGDLNARLRSIISAVRLDARFRPVGIDWTVEPVIIEPGVPTLVDDGVPMVIAGAKPGAWRTGSVGAEGLTRFGESATVRPADPASGSTEESAS